MKSEDRFLSDKEVAAVLCVSTTTVWRSLKGLCTVNGRYLADARPLVVGTQRRWDVGRLAEVCGMTKEEILEKAK